MKGLLGVPTIAQGLMETWVVKTRRLEMPQESQEASGSNDGS
jgi:hypothetical protein